MARAKAKAKVIKIKTVKQVKKKLGLPIAIYVGETEVYFPDFNKIINKGDVVLEMPLKEARARRDFIVKYESED